MFDLADEIYSVREQKPVYAIANDEAFSAAYAIGLDPAPFFPEDESWLDDYR